MHDAALANELAAEHCIRVGDKFWARQYASAAYELYEAWGAKGKSNHLLTSHPELAAELMDNSRNVSRRMSTTRTSIAKVVRGSIELHRRLDPASEDWDATTCDSDAIKTLGIRSVDHGKVLVETPSVSATIGSTQRQSLSAVDCGMVLGDPQSREAEIKHFLFIARPRVLNANSSMMTQVKIRSRGREQKAGSTFEEIL